MTSDCPACHGTGVVVGEPRGHDADGEPLFVQWACGCRVPPAKHESEERNGDNDAGL